MTVFATVDVLSVSTGRLLGDFDGIYKVASYLLGRDVFTHELAYYAERMREALLAAHPKLKGPDDCKDMTTDNYAEIRDKFLDELGPEFKLDEALRECLADDRSAKDTAIEMFGKDSVISLSR